MPIKTFSEVTKYGLGPIFTITEKLDEVQSPFQKIEIFGTTHFGNMMVIDGSVMLTTKDNFLYHEVMSHPALLTHPNPTNVVIIGGGDCGTLREVLKHSSVKSVVQVDIDEMVTRLSEKFFPELCENNNDPRAQLLFIDGIKWMKEAIPSSIDLIIVDSTDPVGPATGLFNLAFYQSCLKALKPNGLLVQQSESPILHANLLKDIQHALLDAGFKQQLTMGFPQPCYPSGWWSATIASKAEVNFSVFREAQDLTTKYYTTAIHHGLLAQPPFFRSGL